MDIKEFRENKIKEYMQVQENKALDMKLDVLKKQKSLYKKRLKLIEIEHLQIESKLDEILDAIDKLKSIDK